MPIEGMPTSNQREAYGGSGGVLSTGFERIFGKSKKDTPVSLEPEAKFKNFLIEMIESEGLGEVTEKRERRPMEEELLYQEELNRIMEKRLASVTKIPKKERREKKKQEEEARAGETESPSTELKTSTERVRTAGEEMVKDYVAMTAKKIVGKPPADMDSVNIRLVELKNLLIEQGLSQTDFSYLDQKALDLIKESFLRLIKDRFFKSSESPIGMIDWILTAKTGRSIFEMLNMLEKDTLSLSDRARLISAFDVQELIELSSSVGLDIDSWMSSLQKEKITIENAGNIDLYFHAVQEPPAREVTALIETYRRSETGVFLEDSFFKRFALRREARRARKQVEKSGIGREEVNEIRTQARKLAWIRTVSLLKDNHLTRILTSSAKEFNSASSSIEKLTAKAKKLGYDMPKEGVRWIETGLTKLAHETAQYKLELLKSLQTIGYEEKRESDIKTLTKIIHDLSRKMKLK